MIFWSRSGVIASDIWCCLSIASVIDVVERQSFIERLLRDGVGEQKWSPMTDH